MDKAAFDAMNRTVIDEFRATGGKAGGVFENKPLVLVHHTGAKSGTAEWGKTGAQQTHAWMIAYNENYAVSAFVEVGDSGGTTAAPLIVQLFS